MKGREEAMRLLEEADELVAPDAVRAAVERMAREISAKLKDDFPVVLSVMGGAAIFTGQLLPLLRFPLEFGAIEVTRYNNDIQGREITWRLPPRDRPVPRSPGRTPTPRHCYSHMRRARRPLLRSRSSRGVGCLPP